MTTYGLMKDATLVAYEIEVTDGTDPAVQRVLWPGIVLNEGTFQEDYGHKPYRPVGKDHRGVHIVQKHSERFEVEIQSLVSEAFTTDDLVSLAFGTVGGTGLVTIAEPLRSFTLEMGWTDGSTPFYYKLSGCKIDTISWAFRPDDLILMTVKIIGRIFVQSNVAEQATTPPGGELSTLAQTTNRGAHFSDVTWSWEDGSGSTLTTDPKITEFDLSVNNNLIETHADNQGFFPDCLIEGNRDVTWSIKTIRQNSELYDIFQADPGTTAGQIRLRVLVNQTAGFYLDFDMGVNTAALHCILDEHELPIGQDVDFLEQSFAGMLVGGSPVIDMQA